MSYPFLAKLYGAFIAIDLRLLLYVALLSLVASFGIVIAIKKLSDKKKMLLWFSAIFIAVFFISLFIFNHIVGYPVFMVRSIFELP